LKPKNPLEPKRPGHYPTVTDAFALSKSSSNGKRSVKREKKEKNSLSMIYILVPP